MRRLVPLLVVLATSAVSGTIAVGADAHAAPRAAAAPPDRAAAAPAAGTSAGCDPIGGWRPSDGRRNCLLPFPNNHFTIPDAHTRTGRRVNLRGSEMPVDRAGKPIDPSAWNRADGFSVGSSLLVDVPGMTKDRDLAASRLPTDSAVGSFRRHRAGVVVLDTRTGRRWPVWAEIDHYTSESGPDGRSGPIQRDLMIHPARNFTPGTRYVVALRGLVGDDGHRVAPTAAFARYRDGTAPRSEPRTPHFDKLFRTLRRAGIRRSGLYLAWDFTTASRANTTDRLLAIRNSAFRTIGDTTPGDGRVEGRSPTFSVQQTSSQPHDRLISGSFQVPCYIAPSCGATGKFLLDGNGPYATPERVPGQTYSASFYCEVPSSAYRRRRVSLRPSLYGHGLFGSPTEVEAGNVVAMANEHHMLECATEWYGMAQSDIPNALADLQDLSNFPTLVDRVQQGELDFLFLSRLMIHPQGFCSDPAFQRANGSCVIDRRHAYYDGNSQGGIYGGTVCAVETDVRHCVLGVTGENYSMLLPRSSDYVARGSSVSYSTAFDSSYPQQSQRMLILDLIQMLWDRGDPDGYAASMTRHPLPHTPRHRVLMQIAWGDHQVANAAAFMEARTVGARVVSPELVPARYGHWRDPFWGLRPIRHYPYGGSALTVFDIGPLRTMNGAVAGTPPPPLDDVPNSRGVDPHEAPRDTVCGRKQKSAFLEPHGRVSVPCGGPPYFADDWNGRSGLGG